MTESTHFIKTAWSIAPRFRSTQSPASGKRVFCRAVPSRASRAVRQRGSIIFRQRLMPGFSALTAAMISSRSASGRRSQAAQLGLADSSRAVSGVVAPALDAWRGSGGGPRPRRPGRGVRRTRGLGGGEVAGGLVVGADRRDEVAGRVLADPLVLVLATASRRPRSWSGSGRPGGFSTSSAAAFAVTPARSAPRPGPTPRSGRRRRRSARAAPDQDDPPAVPRLTYEYRSSARAAPGSRAAPAPPGPA